MSDGSAGDELLKTAGTGGDLLESGTNRFVSGVKGQATKAGTTAKRYAEAGGEAATRAAAREAKRQTGDVNAAEFVDRRKKSRNKEIVRRAEEAARVAPLTGHSLETMDQAPNVVEMARASVEPDWGDNPLGLGTASGVRATLRADGLNPVDVGTPKETLLANALLHKWAKRPNHGGRTPAELEAEDDMVLEAAEHFGLHVTPISMGDDEEHDEAESALGDPFWLAVDLDLGFGGEGDEDDGGWF